MNADIFFDVLNQCRWRDNPIDYHAKKLEIYNIEKEQLYA